MAYRLKTKRCLFFLLFFLIGLGEFCPIMAGQDTITLTDMAGRSVSVPREIKKVVPLGGALRFMVYLQSLDLVAGMEHIEQKWTSPGRLYGLATAKLAKKLPVIGEGGPGKLPDFEQIISVWPDVIVVMGIDDSQAITIQERTGLPVFVLRYGTPGALDLNQVKEAIVLLGRLLGREQRAEELTGYMNRLFTDLATRTKDASVLKERPVYVGAISYKGTQGITSTESGHLPLFWAGGQNVADEIERPGHAFIDPEKLLHWNPEVIFLDAGSIATVAEDFRKNTDYYQKLKAIRQNQVYLTMPYNYYHTNIEIALADAYFMGTVLHPKQFADIDPAVKADEIFRFFIGISAYDSLSGEFHGFGPIQFGDKDLALP
jgi:iron complex transport system substrate-binding protein